MIKKSQSIVNHGEPKLLKRAQVSGSSELENQIIEKIKNLKLQPQHESGVLDMVSKYISGKIERGGLFSNGYINQLMSKPEWGPIMHDINNARQQALQEQFTKNQNDLQTIQLDQINRRRRSAGQPEFQTLQEAQTHKQNEYNQHQSAVKNLYKLIAMGDGDAILESGATYAQVKEAIDNIINRSPSPRGFDDLGHHEEGVSEYLRSMYGIIDSNERVYSFFMNAILSYHSRKENIKNRRDQERQSKIDEAHARRRETIARNREINEDRASLSQSENRARDARLSRVNQQAQINQQRRNQNFSRNRQNFQ